MARKYLVLSSVIYRHRIPPPVLTLYRLVPPLYRPAGDHLYRMDYREFVAAHRAAGADITVAALPCAEEQAQAFGLMKIDDSGRIVEFAEKPKGDALKAMQVGGAAGCWLQAAGWLRNARWVAGWVAGCKLLLAGAL